MEYRTLGRSGCAVSTLALGTMTFGAETDEAGAHAQLDRFLEAGGTLVDTADVYTAGVSEEIIGRCFADRPADVTERVVLATKGRFPTSNEPNGVGLTTRHLTRALDASLRRLGLDAVDLYQVHAFDPWTPLEETLRTLDGFIRAGKIRYYGLSNFTGWQLTKAVHLAAALNPPPAGDAAAAVQPAGPRDRVGDRARGAGRRHGHAAVEPAGRRLAVGEVPQGRAADRRHPARRQPPARDGGLGPAGYGADLGRDRGGADRRGGSRRLDGGGRAGLGDRPAGRHLDHPRRPHPGTARDQ